MLLSTPDSGTAVRVTAGGADIIRISPQRASSSKGSATSTKTIKNCLRIGRITKIAIKISSEQKNIHEKRALTLPICSRFGVREIVEGKMMNVFGDAFSDSHWTLVSAVAMTAGAVVAVPLQLP